MPGSHRPDRQKGLRDSTASVWGGVYMAAMPNPPHMRACHPASGDGSIPQFVGTRLSTDVREVPRALDRGEDRCPKGKPI